MRTFISICAGGLHFRSPPVILGPKLDPCSCWQKPSYRGQKGGAPDPGPHLPLPTPNPKATPMAIMGGVAFPPPKTFALYLSNKGPPHQSQYIPGGCAGGPPYDKYPPSVMWFWRPESSLYGDVPAFLQNYLVPSPGWSPDEQKSSKKSDLPRPPDYWWLGHNGWASPCHGPLPPLNARAKGPPFPLKKAL